MSSYGVLSTGFAKKTVDVILDEIEQEQRGTISEALNLQPNTVLGQINGIVAGKLSEMWDVAEAVYRSFYPDSASGASLDQVASITDTDRAGAQKSIVTLDRLHLDGGVTLTAGRIVSVGETGNQFITLASVTNILPDPATVSVDAEAVTEGPFSGPSGAIDTIRTPVSGWSSASALTCDNTEPYALSDGQTLTIKVDGGTVQTITFNTGDFVDIGNATAAEVAAVIDTDLIGGEAYEANNAVRIATDNSDSGNSIQVTGGSANTALDFSTVRIKGFNSLDALLGRLIETDIDFRIRRIQELRALGKAALDAIKAEVGKVSGVTQVTGSHNTSLITDAYGLPPKSFEIIVVGGDEQDIAETIFASASAGIESYGSTSRSVTDSDGFSHTIKFSRPTPVLIWIALTVLTDPSKFPLDGVAQIKQSLADFGDALNIGEDIVALAFKCNPLEIDGVIDVPVFKIDTVNPPVNTGNIDIDPRSEAEFDTGRIFVTVT